MKAIRWEAQLAVQQCRGNEVRKYLEGQYTALAGIDQQFFTNFVGWLVGKELGRFEGHQEGNRVGSCVGYKYKQNEGKTKSESVWRVNTLHWLA